MLFSREVSRAILTRNIVLGTKECRAECRNLAANTQRDIERYAFAARNKGEGVSVSSHVLFKAGFATSLRQASAAARVEVQSSPLQGLRVLELCSVLAGPSVGQFLAELGCDVIKVENPQIGGDVTRNWRLGPHDSTPSSYFQSCNVGKRSIALDLKPGNRSDRDVLIELVKRSDICLASFKPGDDKKLQVDYETFEQINPSLIYALITGYGPDSGDDRPGYDACVQAEAGFTFLNGETKANGGGPVKMPVALVDILAAHHLKEGILVALLQRSKTNKGRLVHVSLMSAATISLANQAAAHLVAGHEPRCMGSDHPTIVPYGTVFYDLEQKPFVLAVGTDRQFANLVDSIVLPRVKSSAVDSATRDLWSTNPGRCSDRENVKSWLQAQFSQMEREVILDMCAEFSVPAGAVKTVSEVFSHPEAKKVLISAGDGSSVQYISQIGWDGNSRFGLSSPTFSVDQHRGEIMSEISP